ncbi:Threonine/homoserine/homoserine lactone efflux protein [Thalassovita litoralis]|jgi:threonine/homoserine/homoserine lactone efflux protein|uniref:Threonine/homoserine/homoserine lactone efflux protein n=1 Tax=Thalassovita litoralis TaxID=1010611 RepID=A0A521CSU0_9RHOB|nr:LysE family translocator [Thalassovita litoralis]SMO62492.1 Threonine/homoserine/homoserine lactone efflux protein [Thalassovita litoralis]
MIVDPVVLLAFVPAALALNLTPGADMMFCLGQGLRSGPGPAISASAGISAGAFFHALAAGLGLSALVAALPGAFDVIRWIGVGYLLWLAWQSLRQGPLRGDVRGVSVARAFREGLLVNLTNPKVILFVLAFVPQFVDPARAVLPQFLIYGGVLALGGFVINGLVGIFAGGLGRKLARDAGFATWLGRVSAAIFVALAARLALLQRG